MTEKLIAKCLAPILDAEATLKRRRLTIGAATVAAIGLGGIALAARQSGISPWGLSFLWIGLVLVGTLITRQLTSRPPALRAIAKKVEEEHPELQSALLAAMDLKPGENGELSFMQRRLLSKISLHAVKQKRVNQDSAKQ